MPRSREDKHQAVCVREGCGKQFFQRRPGQEYCSQACANKALPGTGGRKPTAGLTGRTCANTECGKEFQPYRDYQVTCSRKCYARLPATRDRNNAARRTDDYRERKNEWRRTDERQVERTRRDNRGRQLARYGLTIEDYDRMLAEQGGACMICGKPPNPDGVKAASKLHADHDHATGQHRDLLCLSCNNGIGYFYDDPVLLRAAAEYIERHREVLVE